jgi:hypothetical protein|nr:MAG TPA: hypothetical protein [Caudoviricetes sp.]
MMKRGCIVLAHSKAGARAVAKYKAKHPGKAKAYQARSYARRFVREYASVEDLQELESLIKARREEIAQDKA